MALANTEFAQAATEAAGQAAEKAGGLPQLNVIADGSFTNQIAWLVITFFVLFFIVWRVVLPRVTTVLGEREENIAGNLDTAERLKADAEEVKAAYETAVANARSKAQDIVLGAKDTIQSDIAKAQADLEGKLNAKAEEAEARISKARDEALASIDSVAAEVASDMVAKLGGVEAKDKAVKDAVSTALSSVKGS
jgi:F-type H+-transporting ATPase subunit b